MKGRRCARCGTRVIIPDPSDAPEEVAGEGRPTEQEHRDETGHYGTFRAQETQCWNCGHTWLYRGTQEHATCGECGSRCRVGGASRQR